MERNPRRRGSARKIQTHLIGDVMQRRGKARLGWEYPRPCRVCHVVEYKRSLGDLDIETSETVTKLEYPLLSRILEQEHGTYAHDPTARTRGGRQQGKIDVANRHLVDGNDVHVEVGRKF